MTIDEYDILENSIKSEGCRDALMLWGEILVDGHNRYEICQRYGIGFKTAQKCFNNVQEAKEWIIFNQFGRRNLNNYQRAELALKLEDIYSQKAKDRMLSGKEIDPMQISAQGTTRDVLSKIAGVSHDTIDKVKKIEAKATDEIKQYLRIGDLSINEVHQQINGKIIMSKCFTGDNEWFTPAEYVEKSRNVMGSIDIDPASSDAAQQIVKAKQYYTVNDNGLDKNWIGNIFLNPPYSCTKIKAFTDKIIEEYKAGHIKQAIVLTNNNTDTTWFHKLAQISTVMCFTKGRIKFYNGEEISDPMYGQVFFYIGNDSAKFKEYFSEVGLIMQDAS
ncbi:MAG TPA: DNA N-6-adenine-methyltransferase [Bacteroidales bacterium]|nr:DNA N-6-adenine-methyltransferase [Bacteroidales bacterium]